MLDYFSLVGTLQGLPTIEIDIAALDDRTIHNSQVII